jgi:reductive dehalogenase
VETPKTRIDERDIMFSRAALREGSGRFDEYYRLRPENKPADDRFRAKPGLLSPDSRYHHELCYAAADAAFATVTQLHSLVDQDPDPAKAADPTRLPPQVAADFLGRWAKHLGAADVGFTRLRDYHLYTHVGRGDNWGEAVDLNHKYALALTVEMDKGMMDRAPDAPTIMESARRYMDAGSIAVQLAQMIRALGYPARAHIDANYRVVCPLVARDAGLGALGRMGLLMTPRLGPRVRLAVVTTDLELPVVEAEDDAPVVDFCTLCKKCAEVCPAQAISLEDRENIDGVLRWQIDSEACYTLWCSTGTDCGRCVSVCPYSHPDNLMHNIVRYGVKRSGLFRRFALWLDNFVYGRRPASKPLQDWVKAAADNPDLSEK